MAKFKTYDYRQRVSPPGFFGRPVNVWHLGGDSSRLLLDGIFGEALYIAAMLALNHGYLEQVEHIDR